MTKRLRPSDDPQFLAKIATYQQIEIRRNIIDGDWRRGLEALAEDLEDNFYHPFMVLLAREGAHTDRHAWFAVACEDAEDAEFARKILTD